MVYKLKNIFFLLSFLVALSTFAQSSSAKPVNRAEMTEVFKKINNWLINTPVYSLTVTHTSYEDYQTIVPADKTVGYFIKNNYNYHSFLMGIHTIQNNNYKLVIDTSEQIIIVANPDKLIWRNYSVSEYDSILKICTSLKVTDKGNDKLYRIELSKNSSIGAYEFLITNDFQIKEIVWYYNSEITKDSEDENSPKSKPRLSIQFSNYKTSLQNVTSEFDEKKYFLKNSDGKLVVSSTYKNYKLLDQRYLK